MKKNLHNYIKYLPVIFIYFILQQFTFYLHLYTAKIYFKQINFKSVHGLLN